MKVSIITATFNSAGTVKDTLLSVNRQSYKDIQHIIIDGASVDNTLDIVRHSSHSGPVISEKDNGIYDAMNKGIKVATGDIVGILNSDDFYSNERVIEKVVRIFEETGCDAVYGDLLFVDQNYAKTVVRKWVAGDFSPRNFYNGWMPPHPTFFVRREVYDKYGDFNLSFKSSADYELLLRFMLVNQIKVQYLPEVMVHMRVGGFSNSSLRNKISAHKEDYVAWKCNDVTPKWYTLAMKPLRKVKQFEPALKPEVAFQVLKPSYMISDHIKSSLLINQGVIVSYALLLTSFINLVAFL